MSFWTIILFILHRKVKEWLLSVWWQMKSRIKWVEGGILPPSLSPPSLLASLQSRRKHKCEERKWGGMLMTITSSLLAFIVGQGTMNLIWTYTLTLFLPWELAHPIVLPCFCSQSAIFFSTVFFCLQLYKCEWLMCCKSVRVYGFLCSFVLWHRQDYSHILKWNAKCRNISGEIIWSSYRHHI